MTANSALANAYFDDWVDIFTLIKEHKPKEKKIVIIDELPYIIKSDPAFPSVMQCIWDEILYDSNIMLILCGSTMHMMLKNVLDRESPLYGRRTSQIRLLPLSFVTVYENTDKSFEDTVDLYSITGGVPKYMEFFDNDRSFLENLKSNVLDTNGFLYEEANFLLKDEVSTVSSYVSILVSIAKGEHKIGDISSYLNVRNSDITPYIATLIDLGIVSKIVPITEKDPARSRKGLYIITDNFIKFWFKYVYPYKGELELNNMQIVLEILDKNFIDNHVSFIYEDICREIFIDLCNKKVIDFIPSKVGKYWKDDRRSSVEIDIVAIDNIQKKIFVGECKYWKRKVDIDVLVDLKRKVDMASELVETFKGHKFIYGLFSKSGFTDKMIEVSKEDRDIILVSKETVV